MPLEPRIDLDARVVYVRGHGTLTAEELHAYQDAVWVRPEVRGFSELLDLTDVEVMPPGKSENIRELAMKSAGMDAPDHPARMAIVAPNDLSFALGRMYGTLRGLMPGSTREAQSFRNREDALAWLAATRPGTE